MFKNVPFFINLHLRRLPTFSVVIATNFVNIEYGTVVLCILLYCETNYVNGRTDLKSSICIALVSSILLKWHLLC